MNFIRKRKNKIIEMKEGDIIKLLSKEKTREVIYVVCENGNLIIKEKM